MDPPSIGEPEIYTLGFLFVANEKLIFALAGLGMMDGRFLMSDLVRRFGFVMTLRWMSPSGGLMVL